MPKTVLITGAGSGFGRDAAIQLARRGHSRISSSGYAGRGLLELRRFAG